MPAADPKLAALLPTHADPQLTSVDEASLAEFVGTWPLPAPTLGAVPYTEQTLAIVHGHLVGHAPRGGTFNLYLQPDGSFHEEDSLNDYIPARDSLGKFIGISDLQLVATQIIEAVGAGETDTAYAMLEQTVGRDALVMRITGAVVEFLSGDPEQAEASLQTLAGQDAEVERALESISQSFINQEDPFLAQAILELKTRLNPKSASAWLSLAEVSRQNDDHQTAQSCRAKARALSTRR